MSTNRHSRILTILAEANKPISIVLLTKRLNERYEKGYAPSLIGSDVKILIIRGLIKIDEKKCFSLTNLGVIAFEEDKQKTRLDCLSCEE